MVLKIVCVLVLRTKVASALQGLKLTIINYDRLINRRFGRSRIASTRCADVVFFLTSSASLSKSRSWRHRSSLSFLAAHRSSSWLRLSLRVCRTPEKNITGKLAELGGFWISLIIQLGTTLVKSLKHT